MTRLLLALALMAGPAWGHDALMGWAYDRACCGGADCEQEHVDAKATDLGWIIASTGETIPYGDRRLRNSGDQYFHRCRMKQADLDSETRCFYVPPSSY